MTSVLRPVLWALGALGAGLLLVGLLVVILQTRDLAGQTRELAGAIRAQQKNNVSTFDLLVDCTDPTGKCFQKGQKRTASAVGSINKITLYAAACADEPDQQTLVEIQTCVLERLAADDTRQARRTD